jgi:hypothetical protein
MVAAGLALLLTASCSGSPESSPVQPALVRGVVTYNGRSMTAGTVTFIPVKRDNDRINPGLAKIEPDGTFWVGNSNLSKPAGLRPGRYKVTVLSVKPRPDGASGPVAKLQIPEEYTREESTPFEVDVVKGQNRFRLDLVDSPIASPSP